MDEDLTHSGLLNMRINIDDLMSLLELAEITVT